MKDSQIDSDRVLVAATLISGLVGLGLYLIVYLTLMQYGTLNANGQAFSRVGLYVLAGTLILSIYLAFAARSRALVAPGMTGIGWFLIFAGVLLACPALGGTINLSVIPGLTSFGGVAGAMFLVLSGSALLQAERNVRQQQQQNNHDTK
jgi:hypothetical protein